MAEEEDLVETLDLDPETTCTICYAEFIDPEDLLIHTQQVHWTSSCRKCDFCPSVYRCLDDYALHIKDTHLLYLKACKYCHRVYSNFDMLRKHENKHCSQRRTNVVNCSQCVKFFSTTQDVAEHELKEHNDSQDGVFLNELFPLLSALLNIKAITFLLSLREATAYTCPCCVFTTNSPNEYLRHLKTKGCTSAVCSKCSNVYKDRKGVTKHLQLHKECWLDSKREDLIKKCSKCEKKVSLTSYKEHVKACKPIKCHVCNIIMKSMYALSEHQSEHHPMTIQMKTCQFCRREFVGNVALQRHFKRGHLKEVHLYKYKCVYCDDMYFKHPTNLFGHLFSKHHDVNPFCCMICNKKFRLRKKFTIHIKLEHNSAGHVEFDENYNVFFTEKKSENPFTPTCLFPELVPSDNQNANQSDNDQTDVQTDVPTDVPTDAQTDVEEKKTVTLKKPPKIRYKEETSKKRQAAMSQSETNMSEAQPEKEENKPKVKRTITRKLRGRKIKSQIIVEDNGESDSDEPLIKVKRKPPRYHNKNVGVTRKERLTCNICKKYCYTLLHYNHHMSLHFKDEVKKCVKCSEEFSSKTALQKHMTEKHSSSQLTETLRNLLERRKKSINGTLPELTPSEKFRKTIKRAKLNGLQTSATIKEIDANISVKKFIEEFTPEESNKKAREIQIEANVSIYPVNYKHNKMPSIRMVKFIPKPPPANVKLALPVRFKEVATEKPKISCRVVHQPIITEQPITPQNEEPEYYQEEDNVDNDHNDEEHYEEQNEPADYKIDIVPEVAQEVMLETQNTQPISIPHKIIIPKIPDNVKSKDISIAHLLPQAPYYKIVKMSEVIKDNNLEADVKTEKKDDDDNVELPAGTRLVNVNPLAHLLGDTTVEQIVGAPSKYHKPKTGNFQKAIAKALLKLEQPQPPRKRPPKKKKEENKEAVAATVTVEQ